jgi:hypothetical protein
LFPFYKASAMPLPNILIPWDYLESGRMMLVSELNFGERQAGVSGQVSEKEGQSLQPTVRVRPGKKRNVFK